MSNIYDIVAKLATEDSVKVAERDKTYGSSWKQRGGVGAFMMLARKWDRIENAVKKHGWDVFHAVRADPSDAGIIDDIRDLRRYLLLVEAELTLHGIFTGNMYSKSNIAAHPYQRIPQDDDAA